MTKHFLTTVTKRKRLLYLIFILTIISSCQPRYEIREIEVNRENWDTLSVNAQCRKITWYGSGEGRPEEPVSQRFTIRRSNGTTLGEYRSDQAVIINDQELDDSELLTITLTATFPKGITQTSETTIYASPKSVAWITNMQITPGLRSFHTNAMASFVRQSFRGSKDLLIEPVMADKTLTISSDSLALLQRLQYSGDEDLFLFSDEFYEELKYKYYRLHSLPMKFVHQVTWKEKTYTNTQKITLDLNPYFSDAWNNYRYTRFIESNGATFYKLYIRKGTIGVFTLKNSGRSGDLDLYAYSGSQLSTQPMIGKSLRTSLFNEILYFPGNDEYVYVKIHNSSTFDTECMLTTHAVNIEDVASQSLADYLIEKAGHAILQGFLKELFGIEDDNKVGDQITNLGADVLLNMFQGASLESATEDALKAKLENALLPGQTAEARAILTKFINNLVQNIYMYY